EKDPAAGVIVRLVEHGADGDVRAGGPIEHDEAVTRGLGLGGDGAVIATERVEVFVGIIEPAVTREAAAGGIETSETAAGIGADPEGAVGRLLNAGGEGCLTRVTGPEILDAAFGLRGIKPVEVPVPRGAEPKDAGPEAAHGADGIVGPGGRGVELA